MRRLFIVKFFLFSLIIGFFLHSCSIEKRRFRSGYYVDWKSNQELLSKDFDFSKDDVVLKKNKDLESLNVKENSKKQKVNVPLLISFLEKNINSEENIQSQTKSYIQEHKHKFELKQKGNKFKKITPFGVPKEPETNLLGLASLILLLTGFLGILSIPMAILAIRQFKKNPGKYKGIWMPILTLILSVLVISLIFTISILTSVFSGPISAMLAANYIITLITIAGIIHVSFN